MAWYRTGNVAVAASDTVVTGTGTLFATHVRVGDGFVGPDGRMYEVTNVASETVISIFPAYRGATATGQDYSIIPVQGYPKQLSDRAGVLVGQVGQLPGRIDDIDDVLSALGSAAGADMPAGVTEFGTAAGAQLTELLTKAGNLAGLDDKAQSQLNLGVILSLAGQVFSTDNCTFASGASGFTIRFANRLQISSGYRTFVSGDLPWIQTPDGKYVEMPSATPVYWATPFASVPTLLSVLVRDSNVGSFVSAVPHAVGTGALNPAGSGVWITSYERAIPNPGTSSLAIWATAVGVY